MFFCHPLVMWLETLKFVLFGKACLAASISVFLKILLPVGMPSPNIKEEDEDEEEAEGEDKDDGKEEEEDEEKGVIAGKDDSVLPSVSL